MSTGTMDKVGNRLMNRFFRRVDGMVWDLMTGKVGIRTEQGILTLEGEGAEAELVENMFDQFGIELPAFAQATKVEDIKLGDLIYGGRGLRGWVVKLPPKTGKGKDFTLLKTDGTRGAWRPPKVKSLGIDLGGAMVLRSLMNTLPDGGLGDMQNMLMPMMMMGGMGGGDGGGGMGFGDLEDMLPMLLMSQSGMMGDAGGGGNMMQTMMMMKMMGGFRGDGDGKGRNFPGGSYFD